MPQATLKAALFSLIILPAFCQGATLSKEYNRCMEKNGDTTVDMQNCIRAEYKKQDHRLNTDYQALRTVLSPVEKKRLRQSEREWLTHRKAKCEHAGDAEAGGTLQEIEIQSCFLDETADRSDALERLLASKH